MAIPRGTLKIKKADTKILIFDILKYFTQLAISLFLCCLAIREYPASMAGRLQYENFIYARRFHLLDRFSTGQNEKSAKKPVLILYHPVEWIPCCISSVRVPRDIECMIRLSKQGICNFDASYLIPDPKHTVY